MYKDNLTKAMNWLAQQNDTLLLGQAVGVHGTFMFDTYKDVPISKRMEFPVCESLQLQFSVGLALQGYVPISIFPRWNFLLLATADIVGTVDKLSLAPIIIRTAVGTTQPIYPGIQHVGDFTDGFRQMVKNIHVVRLDKAEDIVETYIHAYENTKYGISSLIVEVADLYDK